MYALNKMRKKKDDWKSAWRKLESLFDLLVDLKKRKFN